jgi:hypothetical protein
LRVSGSVVNPQPKTYSTVLLSDRWCRRTGYLGENTTELVDGVTKITIDGSCQGFDARIWPPKRSAADFAIRDCCAPGPVRRPVLTGEFLAIRPTVQPANFRTDPSSRPSGLLRIQRPKVFPCRLRLAQSLSPA